MTEDTTRPDERLAHIQNRVQELDPGGAAGRALWAIDALAEVVRALLERVEVLEDVENHRGDVGAAIERAIADHVDRKWHR